MRHDSTGRDEPQLDNDYSRGFMRTLGRPRVIEDTREGWWEALAIAATAVIHYAGVVDDRAILIILTIILAIGAVRLYVDRKRLEKQRRARGS